MGALPSVAVALLVRLDVRLEVDRVTVLSLLWWGLVWSDR